MDKKILKKLNKNLKVLKSKKFDEIMDNYEQNSHLPALTFWREYVLKLDDTISYVNWLNFVKKINLKKEEKIRSVVTEIAGGELELFNRIRSQAYKMGDTVMAETASELMDLLEKGKKIPDSKKKMVMNWVFKTRELDQRDRMIDLKEKGDEREEKLVDAILKQSIYSRKLTPEIIDVEEAQWEEIEEERNAISTLRKPLQVKG